MLEDKEDGRNRLVVVAHVHQPVRDVPLDVELQLVHHHLMRVGARSENACDAWQTRQRAAQNALSLRLCGSEVSQLSGGRVGATREPLRDVPLNVELQLIHHHLMKVSEDVKLVG